MLSRQQKKYGTLIAVACVAFLLSTWVYIASREFVDSEVDREFTGLVDMVRTEISSLDDTAVKQLSILHAAVEVGYQELCDGRDPSSIYPLRCVEDITPLSAAAYGALSDQLIQNLPSVMGSSLIPHIRNDTERAEWEAYMTAVLDSPSPLFVSTYRGSPAPLPPSSGPYFPMALSEHFVLQDLGPNAGYILQGAAVSSAPVLYAAQFGGTVLAIVTQVVFHNSSLPLPTTYEDDNVAGFVAVQILLDQAIHSVLSPITAANKGIWVGISDDRDGDIYGGLNGETNQLPEPSADHDIFDLRSTTFQVSFFDRTFNVKVKEVSPLESKFQESYPFINAAATFAILSLMVLLGVVWQARYNAYTRVDEDETKSTARSELEMAPGVHKI